MSFVTKDGFFIEGDDAHEFVVPHGHRPKFVLDDWSGMTQEELQKVVAEALEKSDLKEIIINSTRLTEAVK